MQESWLNRLPTECTRVFNLFESKAAVRSEEKTRRHHNKQKYLFLDFGIGWSLSLLLEKDRDIEKQHSDVTSAYIKIYFNI